MNIAIVIFGFSLVSILILALAFRFFKFRERTTLIKSGKDLTNESKITKDVILIWASTLIGIAIGFFVGLGISYVGDVLAPVSIIIIIASIAFFTGIALLLCFLYLRKLEIRNEQ
ncbi:MAG TPA: hypothetical protein PLS00_00025 [Niabella sp.]|nr:hypothetical protein [Niabella sp.]